MPNRRRQHRIGSGARELVHRSRIKTSLAL
jgi:hypothetical protein